MVLLIHIDNHTNDPEALNTIIFDNLLTFNAHEKATITNQHINITAQ